MVKINRKSKLLSIDDLKSYVQSLFSQVGDFKTDIHNLMEFLGINLVAGTVYFDEYDDQNECYEWNRSKKNSFNSMTRLYLPFLFKDDQHIFYDENMNTYTKDNKKLFNKLNIKKLIIYPIIINHKLVANLGVVYYVKNKENNQKQLELLKIVEKALMKYYHENQSSTKFNKLLIDHKQLMSNFIYPIVILDSKYKIIDSNPKFEALLNISNSINQDFVSVISSYDHYKITAALDKSFGGIPSDAEIFKVINNEKKIYRLTPFPFLMNDNKLMGVVFKDITKFKIAESKLEKMAFFDSATGLYNRNYFEQVCEKISNKHYNSIGVIIFDIDNLKAVNESFGHDAGDKMIINAAKIIYDVFNEAYLVARIGGDEFGVFILDQTDEEIKTRIQEINNKINCFNRHHEIKMSLSIGYEFQEGKKTCIFDIINKADELMYLYKKHKNNKNLLVL